MNIFGKEKPNPTVAELKLLRGEVAELTKALAEQSAKTETLVRELLKTHSAQNVFTSDSTTLLQTRQKSRSWPEAKQTIRTTTINSDGTSLVTEKPVKLIVVESILGDFEVDESKNENSDTPTSPKTPLFTTRNLTIPSPIPSPVSSNVLDKEEDTVVDATITDPNPTRTSSNTVSSTSTVPEIPEDPTDVDTLARKVLRFVSYPFVGIGAFFGGIFGAVTVGAQSIYTRATTTPELGENEFTAAIATRKEQFNTIKADFEYIASSQTPESILKATKSLNATLQTDILSQLNASEVKTPLIRKQIKEVKSLLSSLATLQKEVEEWSVRIEVSNKIDEVHVFLDEISDDLDKDKVSLKEFAVQLSLGLGLIYEEIEHNPAYKKALKDGFLAEKLSELKTRAEGLRNITQDRLSTVIRDIQEDHHKKLQVFDSSLAKYLKLVKTMQSDPSTTNINEAFGYRNKLKNDAMAIDTDHGINLFNKGKKTNLTHRQEKAFFAHEQSKLRLHERIQLYTEVDGLVFALSELEKTRNGAKSVYKKEIVGHEKNLAEAKSLAGRIKKVEDAKFAKLNTYSKCARETLTRAGNFICSFFMSYESQLESAQNQRAEALETSIKFYKNNQEEIARVRRHIQTYDDDNNRAEVVGSDSYKENATARTWVGLVDKADKLKEEVERLRSIVSEQLRKKYLEKTPLYAPEHKRSFFDQLNLWAKKDVSQLDMEIGEKVYNTMHKPLNEDPLSKRSSSVTLEEFGLENGSNDGKLSFDNSFVLQFTKEDVDELNDFPDGETISTSSSKENLARVYPVDDESILGSIDGSQYDELESDNEEIFVDSINDPMEFNPFIKKQQTKSGFDFDEQKDLNSSSDVFEQKGWF